MKLQSGLTWWNKPAFHFRSCWYNEVADYLIRQAAVTRLLTQCACYSLNLTNVYESDPSLFPSTEGVLTFIRKQLPWGSKIILWNCFHNRWIFITLYKNTQGSMYTDRPCFSGSTMDSCGTNHGAARLSSIWMLNLWSAFWEGQYSPCSRWSDGMNTHNATIWKQRNHDS